MEPEGSLPHSLVPATVPILSQLDPVHTPTAHFLKIRPNNYFEFWNNLKKYKDNGVCMCVWCVCICVRVGGGWVGVGGGGGGVGGGGGGGGGEGGGGGGA
jgi:hypothetical protein